MNAVNCLSLLHPDRIPSAMEPELKKSDRPNSDELHFQALKA